MVEKRVVPFRQADVTRAIKGATAGGMPVGRVEIGQDGRIVILVASAPAKPENAFDGWKADHDARPA